MAPIKTHSKIMVKTFQNFLNCNKSNVLKFYIFLRKKKVQKKGNEAKIRFELGKAKTLKPTKQIFLTSFSFQVFLYKRVFKFKNHQIKIYISLIIIS